MSIKKTITISKAEAEQIQDWLDDDHPIPDCGHCEVVQRWTAKFNDVFEADIKLCNGNTGPYLDCILFENGNECDLIEPQYDILGDFPFQDREGNHYIATIVSE